MRRITRQVVEKWLAAPWQRIRRNMAPYPCKTGHGYPTRLYAVVKYKDGEFAYIGKPSQTAIASVKNALKNPWLSYTIAEFDRKGLIAVNSRTGYVARDTNGNGHPRWVEPIAQYYSPWVYGGDAALMRFATGRLQRHGGSKLALYVTPDAAPRDLTNDYYRLATENGGTIE
jgi:hypothetical protein